MRLGWMSNHRSLRTLAVFNSIAHRYHTTIGLAQSHQASVAFGLFSCSRI